MKEKVLVFAVHPDDETLGCGGTLLKHKANGDSTHWVICTAIDKSNIYYQKREKEIESVKEVYGFDTVHSLDLKTTLVDEYGMRKLVENISQVIGEIEPTTIYLPFRSDVHSDHRKIFEAAYSCTKSFRYPFLKKIYMMETLSETEFAPSLVSEQFIPNRFVDISDYLDFKIDIMKLYESEIAPHPFPRSEENIRALATYRGATSGCMFAESFVILKCIE